MSGRSGYARVKPQRSKVNITMQLKDAGHFPAEIKIHTACANMLVDLYNTDHCHVIKGPRSDLLSYMSY